MPLPSTLYYTIVYSMYVWRALGADGFFPYSQLMPEDAQEIQLHPWRVTF